MNQKTVYSRSIANCITMRLFLVIVLIVTGCGPKNPTVTSRAYTDALGRSVSLPDSIHRIITLAPSATETVFAAGASRKLIGVTTADNFPPEVKDLVRITAFPAIDYERILANSPDLILASAEVNGSEIADRMDEFGIPVFYLGSSTFGDVFDNIRTVGMLAGTSEAANSQAGLLEQSVLQISEMAATASTKNVNVLVLIGIDELYSFGNGSYVNEMIRNAGGVSITENIPMAAPVLSEEFVLAQQPEVIIVAMGPDFETSKLLTAHPTWTALSAVQNDRVFSIDPDLLLRPGPRTVDGVLFLASWITPDFLTSGQAISGQQD